jgi:hypothetical protein
MPSPSYIEGTDAIDVMRETMKSDDKRLIKDVGMATEMKGAGPWNETFHFGQRRLGG